MGNTLQTNRVVPLTPLEKAELDFYIKISRGSDKAFWELVKKYYQTSDKSAKDFLKEVHQQGYPDGSLQRKINRRREKLTQKIKISQKMDRAKLITLLLNEYPDPDFFTTKNRGWRNWTGEEMKKVFNKKDILVRYKKQTFFISNLDCSTKFYDSAIKKYINKQKTEPNIKPDANTENFFLYQVTSVEITPKFRKKDRKYNDFKKMNFYLGPYKFYLQRVKSKETSPTPLKNPFQITLPKYLKNNECYWENAAKIAPIFPLTAICKLKNSKSYKNKTLYYNYIHRWAMAIKTKFSHKKDSIRGLDCDSYFDKIDETYKLEKALYLQVAKNIFLEMPETVSSAKLIRDWKFIKNDVYNEIEVLRTESKA
jgi:hypothetical protein